MLPKRKRRLRPPGRGRPDAIRRLLAWGVHLYTAMGLVAAAGMAVLIVRGGPHDFHRVFLLMLVATLIDATDGALARRVRVKEVLPGFDGRRLDDLTDFLTYTFLPLLLLWRADVLPAGQGWWLLLPLLASTYGFSQVCAKTPDGYFLGFPSYWNLVAFYLYVLRPPAWVVISILVVFAFLTFVPLRYLYPSQGGRLNRLTNLLGAVWTALLIGILLNPAAHEFPGEVARGLTLLSLAFPIYYLAASWVISLRLWRRARARKEMQEAPYPV